MSKVYLLQVWRDTGSFQYLQTYLDLRSAQAAAHTWLKGHDRPYLDHRWLRSYHKWDLVVGRVGHATPDVHRATVHVIVLEKLEDALT